MALGGGVWFTQNKKLPGSYINFVSLATAAPALSDRGVVAIALPLDWGKDGEIIELNTENFFSKCQKILGYDFTHVKMKGLRDIFLNARTVYLYKLNSASTGIATCTYATALCSGVRGNALKIIIAKNADDNTKWDVSTALDGVVVDIQTVAAATGLVDNDYVTFDPEATLAVTAGTALTGGANATITNANYQTFLDLMESYSFNAIGLASDDAGLKSLYVAWVKRMRDELGIKVQGVLYDKAADYEGIVNVATEASETGEEYGLVYWALGVVGSVAINASATNKVYDGEYTPILGLTQHQLETAIDEGKFVLHNVGKTVRVLTDINSLVTTTADKGDLFKSNQTIRIIDEFGNSIANIFNTKYLGQIPNDDDGRTSLWGDIVALCKELERVRAIENFDEESVKVEAGDSKRAVLVEAVLTIINAMEQLYMTTVIQ